MPATPTERCSLIARRLRDSFRRKVIAAERARRKQARPRVEKRLPWEIRLQQARHRREQLEAEREAWLRAVFEFGGSMKRIARHMGYAEKTASKAIWDLGYWPELVKARDAVYTEEDMERIKTEAAELDALFKESRP